MSESDTTALLQLVLERTGLSFGEARESEVQGSVRRAMKEAGYRTPGPYVEAVASQPRLMDALLTVLTVGESFFFREPGQLDFIRRVVLPEHRSRSAAAPRAWSAGCATGEEAYTLAIVLGEAGLSGGAPVLGTDLSAERIVRARRGRYRKWSLRGVPEETVARYFRRRGDWYELVPEIRERVEFRQMNLLEPSQDRSRFDLILCRNVLIYLDAPSIERVARRLYDALEPAGWLILGASDPLLASHAPFEIVTTGAGVAYHRPPDRPAVAPDGESMARGPGLPGQRPSVPPEMVEGRRRIAPPVQRRATPAPRARESAAEGNPARRAPDSVAEEDAVAAAVEGVWALADSGRTRQAEVECEEALHRLGHRAELLGVKALLLSASGRRAEARAAARQALYLDDGLIIGHVAVGEAADDAATALRAFGNAVRLLMALPPTAAVPGTRGTRADELAALTRLRVKTLEEGRPSGE